MERILKSLGILGSAAVAIVCFQNCSNVAFTAAQSDSVSKIGTVNLNDDADAPPTDDELRKTCQTLQENQAQLIAISEGGSVADISGNTILKAAGNISNVARIYGSFNILGTQAGSVITTIEGSRGNILVCGMSVGEITNYTRGNLTVVGGNVGNVDQFSGSLRVIDGQITGTVANSNGNIASN